MNIIIAASILAADFKKLPQEVTRVQEAGADWIHIDIMDGRFVPNTTIGAKEVSIMRKATRLTLDSHLMVENPERYIDDFIKAGTDIITIHIEAEKNPRGLIQDIKSRGIKTGISIKPKTPVSAIDGVLDIVDLVVVMTVEPGLGGQKFMADMLPKISAVRKKFEGNIQVDGGINAQNAKLAKDAGANVLVAGTYIFGAKNMKKAVESLR